MSQKQKIEIFCAGYIILTQKLLLLLRYKGLVKITVKSFHDSEKSFTLQRLQFLKDIITTKCIYIKEGQKKDLIYKCVPLPFPVVPILNSQVVYNLLQ